MSEEQVKKSIEIIDASTGKTIGEMTTEDANNILSSLLIDNEYREEFEVIGTKVQFKTITRKMRKEALGEVSGVEGSNALLKSILAEVNLKYALASVGDIEFEDIDKSGEFVEGMDENLFEAMYDKYLYFVNKVRAAVQNKDSVKN
ncbi:MAG: hypothetical protein SVK08_00140 [Halobacteriota archaeon]|nr:hypothetical protein [Halobacteriota archaeon]